jgi:hypothetical protein
VLAFYWGRRRGGLARKLRQEDHTIPIRGVYLNLSLVRLVSVATQNCLCTLSTKKIIQFLSVELTCAALVGD